MEVSKLTVGNRFVNLKKIPQKSMQEAQETVGSIIKKSLQEAQQAKIFKSSGKSIQLEKPLSSEDLGVEYVPHRLSEYITVYHPNIIKQ